MAIDAKKRNTAQPCGSSSAGLATVAAMQRRMHRHAPRLPARRSHPDGADAVYIVDFALTRKHALRRDLRLAENCQPTLTVSVISLAACATWPCPFAASANTQSSESL
jgi:hypothetical protein